MSSSRASRRCSIWNCSRKRVICWRRVEPRSAPHTTRTCRPAGISTVGHKPGNLDHALELMQKAINLDPHFGLAYAGFGRAKWRKFTVTRDPKLLEDAQDLAQHAIGIDKRVALADVTLGIVYKETGRYADSIR